MSIKIVFPPRKILVPLDFSEGSAAAWNQAKSLGASFGARVDGLFVQPWFAAAVGAGFLMPSPMPLDMEATLRALRRSLGATKEEITLAEGGIENTILSCGEKGAYDLIIMGTHGRSGLQRLLMGSVAETVVRHATIPVLVLRRGRASWRHVLAPVHFEPYAVDGLSAAADIAASLGARLTAMHVVESPIYGGPGALKGSKHLLADAVNRLPAAVRDVCRPKTKLAFGDPAEQIAVAAAAADLVVLVARRKGFVNDMVLGTTTERLLRRCDTPILALPFAKMPHGSKWNSRERARSL